MGKSADAIAARQKVYDQLSKRFPAKAIEWVKSARWDPVTKEPLSKFDTSDRTDWAASSDPDKVAEEIQKWKDGTANPAVAIQIGASPQLIIVDGHHRFIAREHMHKNTMATYVGHVPNHTGPWMTTHLSQRGGPSGAGNPNHDS